MKKVFVLFFCMALPAAALVAPEKYMADSSCPKNAPFTGPEAKCISCDTPRGLMLADPKDCDLCPNRTVDSVDTLGGWITSNYCRLKECPPDKPFYEEKWNWSGCKNCEDKPSNIKKEQCEQCPNMRWIKEIQKCVPSETDFIYYGGERCTADGAREQLVGGMSPYRFACKNFSFDTEHGIVVSEEECGKCPNTYMENGCCLGKK